MANKFQKETKCDKKYCNRYYIMNHNVVDINCEYYYDRKTHIHSYWLAGNHDYSDYLFMGGHKA